MYKINQIKTDGLTFPWVLRATLLSKTPLATSSVTKRLYFSAMFKDETGTIRAVAFDNFGDIEQAHNFLQTGSVYNIKDATVKNANKKFGSTGTDFDLILPMLSNMEMVEEQNPAKKTRKNEREQDVQLPSTSATGNFKKTTGCLESKVKQEQNTFAGKKEDANKMQPIFISEVDEKVWGYPVCIDCTQKLEKFNDTQWICHQCDEPTEQFKWNLSIIVRAFDGKSLYYITCNGPIAEIILDQKAATIGAVCMGTDAVDQQTELAMNAAGNVFLATIVENFKQTGKSTAKITAITNQISTPKIISLIDMAIKMNDKQRVQMNTAFDDRNRILEESQSKSTTIEQQKNKVVQKQSIGKKTSDQLTPMSDEETEAIEDNVQRSG